MAAPKLILTRNCGLLSPDALSTAELADEYGRADNALELAKPSYTVIEKRRDALRIELQARATNEPANASTFFEGRAWRIEAGPKKFVAILPSMSSLHRLYKAAKRDFYLACTVTLGHIETDLGTPTFERIVTRGRTGARELTAVAQLPLAA